MTFLVRKPWPCGPGAQVFWPRPPALSTHCCTLVAHRWGRKQRVPWLQPAPTLLILTLGCWNSQGGLNKSKLIAGDSFGPDSETELGEETVETYVWPQGCLQVTLISICDDRWLQQGDVEGPLPHTLLPREQIHTHTHTHTHWTRLSVMHRGT